MDRLQLRPFPEFKAFALDKLSTYYNNLSDPLGSFFFAGHWSHLDAQPCKPLRLPEVIDARPMATARRDFKIPVLYEKFYSDASRLA